MSEKSLLEQARELLRRVRECGSSDGKMSGRLFMDLIEHFEAVVPVLESKAVHLPLGASEEYRERRTLALTQMAFSYFLAVIAQGEEPLFEQCIDKAERFLRLVEKRNV